MFYCLLALDFLSGAHCTAPDCRDLLCHRAKIELVLCIFSEASVTVDVGQGWSGTDTAHRNCIRCIIGVIGSNSSISFGCKLPVW